MKYILAIAATLSVNSAFAHVGNHAVAQHSAEHFLIALALVPVLWLSIPRARKVISRIRNK